MSSLNLLITFLSIFLLLHPSTSSPTDILSPFLSPFIDEICKDIVCGKGKCKASLNHTLGYICECDSGWKQSPLSDEKNLRFLPCVIPNCTLDYSCTKAETPAPQVKDPPRNSTFFDPCNWAYCGEGSCMKSSTFGHKCECGEGYDNLLNATTFPCFSECSLGMDCSNLGIVVSNKSTTPTTPVLSDSGKNHASPFLPGKFLWLMILMMTMAMIPWK